MKRTLTTLLLTAATCLLLSTPMEARRRYGGRYNSGASALGFFAGAFAGATLAGAYDSYPAPYYYGYGPRPVYGYDYPAYAYNPMYAYQRTAWGYYPYGY
ncbi:hypothetical protein H0W26_01600 [Candidatus Dependentiae bacterium]|nr:hypothetical protein [Candidatus Dependentiae bacterium]